MAYRVRVRYQARNSCVWRAVVVAWPLRPVLRNIGLAAATPEVLAFLGRSIEAIEDERLTGTRARMRKGWLLTISIDE